jgi:hypothetical protein
LRDQPDPVYVTFPAALVPVDLREYSVYVTELPPETPITSEGTPAILNPVTVIAPSVTPNTREDIELVASKTYAVDPYWAFSVATLVDVVAER